MAISGWFVGLLGLGALPVIFAGADRGVDTAIWLVFVLLLAVTDLVLAGSPAGLAFDRDVPARLRLGETAEIELTVTNTGRRRVRGLLRDAWPPSTAVRPARVPLSVPARERRMIRMSITPFRRGERRAAHVTVRSFGPLRLVARQRTFLVPGAVRVLPPFNSRRHLPSRLARLRELDGRTSVLIRGQGTEFDSLREYVRGDDVRSIDWRATARRRDPLVSDAMKLVVRTWRPERDRRVVIVVDSGRTSAARIADEPRLDTSFESSLLLSALATRAGDRVDLVVWDRLARGRVQGLMGAALMAQLVDVMAPIEPALLETDWSAVPALVRSVTSQRALVVLLTSIDAPGSVGGLLAMLPQLTRNHVVVVASVTDPGVLDAAGERANRADVYRAAAAERALLDAARVSAALRQSGAEVVTGAPQDLPPALADRYIALKAAGRL